MILCIDIGNSHLFGGVFKQDKLQLRFRYDSRNTSTSDQLGIFLKSVLRENHINPDEIQKIAICSVVPSIDYSIRSACKKYFDIDPFMLQAGVKTGLKIKYRNPVEVGADRIANAIAAVERYPNQNIIVIDFGTGTTLCAITANKEYLGGAIHPGFRLSSEALQNGTAKLSSVEIIKPSTLIGRSTTESIQSGLFYGQLGLVKELTQRIHQEKLFDTPAVLLATGGFSQLFSQEKLFDAIIPDLALYGLKKALSLNENMSTMTA
ncbi:MAG: type III pantothenate kinase [Proteobacteria bacterium]|nr:type III pantothenate kinase [Pseudomonadota bacterium]